MRRRVVIALGIIIILVGSFFIYLNNNYVLPILMYHSLDKNQVDTYAAVSIEVFQKQMKAIKKAGLQVISLDKYCQLLKEDKSVPRNSVIITFDDGAGDTLAGIKILKEYNYPATIFFIPTKINTVGYLSADDILSFLKDSKISVGSHTFTHSYLPDVDSSSLNKEITGSKEWLESRFGQEVDTISYPIGGFTEEVIGQVKKANYLCACATNRGFSKKLNRFALRRVKVTNRDRGFIFRVKLSGFYNIFRKVKKPY